MKINGALLFIYYGITSGYLGPTPFLKLLQLSFSSLKKTIRQLILIKETL